MGDYHLKTNVSELTKHIGIEILRSIRDGTSLDLSKYGSSAAGAAYRWLRGLGYIKLASGYELTSGGRKAAKDSDQLELFPEWLYQKRSRLDADQE